MDDSGHTFYIILKGKVNVRIPKNITVHLKVKEFIEFRKLHEKFISNEDNECEELKYELSKLNINLETSIDGVSLLAQKIASNLMN